MIENFQFEKYFLYTSHKYFKRYITKEMHERKLYINSIFDRDEYCTGYLTNYIYKEMDYYLH